MSERYGFESTTKKAHMKWRLARNNNTVNFKRFGYTYFGQSKILLQTNVIYT